MSKIANYRTAALELLSEPMPFAAWMALCKGAGIPSDVLQGWPAWKAAGDIHTTLNKEGGAFVLVVARGES